MKDFDANQQTLRDYNYVSIVRRPIEDKQGEWFWLYTCSCQAGYSTLASGISETVGASRSELPFPSCLHSTVAKALLVDMDTELGVSPSAQMDADVADLNLQPDLFEVDLTGTLPQVGVMADNTVAVVGAQRSALTCFTCVHKTHCTHCSVVQQYMSAIIDESKVSLLPNGFLVLRDLLVNVKSDRSGSESHPSSVVKGVSNTPIPHTPSVDEPLHLTEAIPENSRCPQCSLQLYSKTDRVYIGRYPMISMIKVLSIKGEHLKYNITAKALNFFLCGHGCVKYMTVYLLL
jgi:hypothetical protein